MSPERLATGRAFRMSQEVGMATIVRVTDDATRGEIAEAITHLRAKAQRLSRHDPRRGEIDDEVDLLVAEWLAADA